jgi:cytochrome oxidase assembly protein ShyY1
MTVPSTSRPAAPPDDGGAPRPSGIRRWAFLGRPGWLLTVALVLLFAAACFTVLAPWQFDRHGERSAQNAAIEAAAAAPAAPVEDLLSAQAEPSEADSWRRATATGAFVGDGVVIRLRQDAGGSPASHLVVPFRLAGSDTVVLVDRGTVPPDDVATSPAPPAGTVSITGRVQTDETDPAGRPLVERDGRLEAYAIDSRTLPGVLAVSGPVLHGYLQLTADSPGVLTAVEVPQVDSGPFLSYALQWCAFGLIGLIGLGVFVVREVVDPRPPDERDGSPAGGGADPAAGAAPVASPGAPRRRFDRRDLYDPE